MVDAHFPKYKRSGRFPETSWTNLNKLQAPSATDQQNALDLLSTRYWTPIFQYLRSKGQSDEAAQDLAQDFFLFAMTSGLFSKANRERGRFRTFLLTALNNFVANEWRRESSQRRHPSGGMVSLDEFEEDTYITPAALRQTETPELLFHRSWLCEVVRNVLTELEQSFESSGKSSHFILFRSRVVAPELEGVQPPALELQAQEFRLEYKEAANRITTAKRAFVRLLVREIGRYAGSEEETAMEKAEVLALLRL